MFIVGTVAQHTDRQVQFFAPSDFGIVKLLMQTATA